MARRSSLDHPRPLLEPEDPYSPEAQRRAALTAHEDLIEQSRHYRMKANEGMLRGGFNRRDHQTIQASWTAAFRLAHIRIWEY